MCVCVRVCAWLNEYSLCNNVFQFTLICAPGRPVHCNLLKQFSKLQWTGWLRAPINVNWSVADIDNHPIAFLFILLFFSLLNCRSCMFLLSLPIHFHDFTSSPLTSTYFSSPLLISPRLTSPHFTPPHLPSHSL